MIFSDAQGQISSQPPLVSFLDHGFLFGDSLYEVIRTYGSKVWGWDAHMTRLEKSAELIGLDLAPVRDLLKPRAQNLLSALNEKDAALRWIVTRGIGPLHINPLPCNQPQVYMAAWKFEATVHMKPVRLMIPTIRRVSKTSLNPAIKSGNYLNSVLAVREAMLSGADDALMLNDRGEATELTTSNFGFIRAGKICTPSTDVGILHGITRQFLVSQFEVEQAVYTESHLKEADEIFALSTFKEVVPVSEILWSDGSKKEYRSWPQIEQLQKDFHLGLKKHIGSQEDFYPCTINP
jgi:branched-chain amino acid aminotransferase